MINMKIFCLGKETSVIKVELISSLSFTKFVRETKGLLEEKRLQKIQNPQDWIWTGWVEQGNVEGTFLE